MATVVRVDVRKTEAEARTLEAQHLGKHQAGLTVSVERATLAVWNWSPDGTAADTVASDSDGEVWIVIARI